MSRLSGHVFDVYDDVDGQVLRSVIPSPENIPEFVKTAHHLSEDQLVSLSDDRFALVMLDQGVKLKKYAMVDKGNTALSVMYLLKQAHLLPPEAVKTAARNLLDACYVWDLDPPEQLKLAADTGLSSVSGRSNLPYTKNAKVVKLNYPGKESAKQTTENPRLGQQDGANDDVDQRTNMSGVQGSNFLEVPRFSDKEKEKTSGLARFLKDNAKTISRGNPVLGVAADGSHQLGQSWAQNRVHANAMGSLSHRSPPTNALGRELKTNARNELSSLQALGHTPGTGRDVTMKTKTAGVPAGLGASPRSLAHTAGQAAGMDIARARKAATNLAPVKEVADHLRRGNALKSLGADIRAQEGQYNIRTAGASGDASGEIYTKQQSWRESPYLDVTGWDPDQAEGQEAPAPQQTLLEGKYPIDGYDQVKTASVYFEENWRSLPHRDRHPYCVKLATRMTELGIDIPEDIQRYGSETYAADVDSYVSSRRGYVEEEFVPMVDLLLEKRAQVSPETFVEALADFDDVTGLRWHWDGKVADPWYSTFGPSIEKLAEDHWRYIEAGTSISEDDLQDLALNDYTMVANAFGEEFATEFQKNPKAAFQNLKEPRKLLVARMASDRFSGVGNT